MTVTAKLNSKNIWYDFRNIVWKYIETNKIISPQDIGDDITVSEIDSRCSLEDFEEDTE